MKYDVIIIGAGIVGLSTAFKIQNEQPTLSILILDKENEVSNHQTGNNSGVIHSGLYYKPGSLKATNCVNGYHQLVDFCKVHKINYELCGKVVIATNKEEIKALEALYQRGKANGLEGLQLLGPEQIKEIEPHANGIKGLRVPQTGIVNFKDVARKISEIVKQNGNEFLFGHKVTDIKLHRQESVVFTGLGQYSSRLVINCAGLYADKVASWVNHGLNFKIIPFRGEYYKLKDDKHHLVNNLIYPVPNPNFPFLGVHFTRMIKGGVEAGPNAVLAYKREGYNKSDIDLNELSESLFWPGFIKLAKKYWKTGIGELYRSYSKTAFTKALQKLLPEITTEDLMPGGSGVRAQACDRNGNLIDDFLILEKPGMINVCNAPSPAATSSLSIGQHIAALAINQLKLRP